MLNSEIQDLAILQNRIIDYIDIINNPPNIKEIGGEFLSEIHMYSIKWETILGSYFNFLYDVNKKNSALQRLEHLN